MKKNKENGQILVILAVAMVALLVITALAVDGSMVYNDRRTDQSTADSASLAGAGAAAQILKDFHPSLFVCGGGAAKPLAGNATAAAITAAQKSALEDDVTLTSQDLTTGNGVQVFCGADEFGQKYLDITVVVTTNTPTTFAKLISRDEITTSVTSTARVYPKQPFAFGNGIVSLSKSCGQNVGGIDFSGNTTVTVKNAGVFSNSCINGGGSSYVNVIGGAIQYGTTCNGSADPNSSSCLSGNWVTAKPIKATVQLPTHLLEPPVCTNAPYKNAPSSGEMTPGNYYGIAPGNKATLTLKPGLYCLKGNLTINSQSDLRAEKVTLYFIEGDVDMNQNHKGLVFLTAPDCETADALCGVPPAIRGVLMYFNPAKPHNVSLMGDSDNFFEGTIYGENVTYKITGNSTSDSFKAQLIGSYFYMTGNSTLTMNLDGAEMYQKPSSIELLK